MTRKQMLEVVRSALAETGMFPSGVSATVENGALVVRFSASSGLAAAGKIDAATAWLGNEMQFGQDFGPLFAPPFKPAREIDGGDVTLRWALS